MKNVNGSLIKKVLGNRRGNMLIFSLLSITALSLIAFEIGRNYVFTQKTRIASADKLDYYRMLTSVHSYFLNAVQKQICLNPEAGYIPTLDASGAPTGACPQDWSAWLNANPTNTSGNNVFIPEKLLIGWAAIQGINEERGQAFNNTDWALGFEPLSITIFPSTIAATPLHPLSVLFGSTSGMRAAANIQKVVITMKRLQVADIPYDEGADTYVKFRVELHLAGLFRFLPQVLFVESIYGFHPIHNYKYALRVAGELDLSPASPTEKAYGIPRVPMSDLDTDANGQLVGGLHFDGYTRSEGLVLPKTGQFNAVSFTAHLNDPPGMVKEATASGTQEFTPRTAGATGGNLWNDLDVWLGAKKIIQASYNDDGLATWAGLKGSGTNYDPAKALECADLGKSNTLESTKETKVLVTTRDGGNDRSGERLTSKFYIGFSRPNYFWPQGDGGITSRPEVPAPGNPMPDELENLQVTAAVDPVARVHVKYKVGGDWIETRALLGTSGEAEWTWTEFDIDAATRAERLALDAAKPNFLDVMGDAGNLRSALQDRLDEVIAANVDLDAKQKALEDGATTIDSDLKGYRRTEASERTSKFDGVKTVPQLCISNCSSSDVNEISFIDHNALKTYIDGLKEALERDKRSGDSNPARWGVWEAMEKIDDDSGTDYGSDSSKKSDRDAAWDTRKDLTKNPGRPFSKALSDLETAYNKIRVFALAKKALQDKIDEFSDLIGGKPRLTISIRPHVYGGKAQREIMEGKIQLDGNKYARSDLKIKIVPFDGRYNLAGSKNADPSYWLPAEDALFSYSVNTSPRRYGYTNIPSNWTPISESGNNSAVAYEKLPKLNFDYTSLIEDCKETGTAASVALHDVGRTEQTWMAQADTSATDFSLTQMVFDNTNATFATAGGTDRTLPNVTVATCEVKSNAEIVTGYLNCMDFIIRGGRTKPLYIVGSVNVVRQLNIAKDAIQRGIYWLNPHVSPRARYVLAQAKLLGDGNSPSSCENSWYGDWNNWMQVAMPIMRYQMFVLCETSVFVQSSSHLKGSSVDPGPMPHPRDLAGNIDKEYYRHVEYATGQISFFTNLIAN
ncbi:MAG: hypothetical protein R3B54_14270 [Bdellovibrionota bacterium]